MLYLIGLGLGDKGISLEGLEMAQSCECYCDIYTSRIDLEAVAEVLGRKPIIASRSALEENAHILLEKAREDDVAILVGGDPLAATTHIELAMEARRQGIPCRIIHGASILTAVAETGLQAYKFGKVGSVVFPPRSNSTAYEVLEKNLSIGLHTLLLLDLDGDRYMDAAEAVEALLQEEQQTGKGLLQKDTQVVVCAGLGTSDARIWVGHADSVQRSGPYPQCLVIPGNLHFAEKDALASHTVPER